MSAFELLESGIEPLSPTFRAELDALTGIARVGEVDRELARRIVWGDLVSLHSDDVIV